MHQFPNNNQSDLLEQIAQNVFDVNKASKETQKDLHSLREKIESAPTPFYEKWARDWKFWATIIPCCFLALAGGYDVYSEVRKSEFDRAILKEEVREIKKQNADMKVQIHKLHIKVSSMNGKLDQSLNKYNRKTALAKLKENLLRAKLELDK